MTPQLIKVVWDTITQKFRFNKLLLAASVILFQIYPNLLNKIWSALVFHKIIRPNSVDQNTCI